MYDPTEANAQCHADPAVEEPVPAPWRFGRQHERHGPVLARRVPDGRQCRDHREGLLDVLGVDTPFTGLEWGFNGAESAENQNHSNSFITTSGILDPALYPQFESWVSAKWDRVGGPFEPPPATTTRTPRSGMSRTSD